MHPLSSFDNLPIPTPASSSATMPPTGTQASHVSDRPQIPLPKVGQTRCYWSLLTPDLNFLYLDPVLANHLGDQAELLIGKSLLAYVHPDEQASAKLDLGSVLESRTLHGSVTRVRYSRLSRVRRQLGYTGPIPEWPDADKISFDDNYLAIDIVINWAADGLVLCFMHAVVDLTPRDNDEYNKSCWTNWCGTPYMSMEQVHLLYNRLSTHVATPPNTSRVFQILLNQPERPLWMSWPLDQQGNGPTSKDFARLAEDVQINNAISSGTDAKTSCTRRYKALQMMQYGVDNNSREVESIFIPHGAIIFACHKVNAYPRGAMAGGGSVPQQAYNSNGYAPQGNQQYYEQPPHSYSLPPVPAPSPYTYNPQGPQQIPPHYSPNSWSGPESSGSHQYNQWSPGSSLPSAAPVSSMRSSSYSTGPPPQHQWSSQPPSYLDSGSSASANQLSMQYPPTGGHDGNSPSPPNDMVPASRTGRRGPGSTREQYGNGGRSSGNPPVGISKCSSCKVTHSPEWRKGPSGKKDLCNACGLRYARSRAKKEGGVSQRRRKDRALSAMSNKSEQSQSGSPVGIPYGNMRRGSYYDDAAFASNSPAGSVSGNEAYPHAHHPGNGSFDGMTPSPSPPQGNMNYVPYSQHAAHHQNAQADGRSSFAGHANQFYSIPPPPLPNGAMHHIRLSPVVSPSSPVSTSPLSGGLSAASFERENKHDKDHERMILPPTSASAETRYVGKSGFMAHSNSWNRPQ
ncbi:hypothetical protein A0H81_07797 [Grifola frondosa]|uniref:GATA-type domain-containing protein n=1 Tax=Grifola frondosa TaxID=5627 RepID=A0A1C7MB61_GRIFR|nr:hypothetical protein A0H81_07797 [Grifola frondosa]